MVNITRRDFVEKCECLQTNKIKTKNEFVRFDIETKTAEDGGSPIRRDGTTP